MKTLKVIAGLAIGLCVVEVVQAAPMPPVGKWQCYAVNNRGMRWFQNASDRQAAMQGARQRCFSAGSRYCHISRDDCRYNQGKFWTCRVRDHRGRIFRGNDTTAKYACQNAKHQCRHWHNKRGIKNYECVVVSEGRS